ncbi:zinc metallopeptidase [filamentous cyanobacterium LEGE 11480]|uniref:Zinc metallopeptidase n=2 Tax=Romeriopsis TaxID=2992131 RepID=A0A928VP56_9CYAN|nr:zinc metallopeptidase [Romeriopsis navalis LEGE 11480]
MPYWWLVIPGMLLSMWASFQVQGTFRKYAQVSSSLGMTGAEVAEAILNRMGVHNVRIEHVAGELTDHYDPGAKTVRLSDSVYGSNSLAAAAVAAHECGHVLQDVQGYKFMNVRAAVFPVTQLGSNLAPWIMMAGVGLLFVAQQLGSIVLLIGIVLFAAVVLFHVVTLPVEFDASSRALKLIDELGILQGDENRGARKVLNAAALTYVAAALVAALQLLQYVLIFMNSSRR